MNIGASRCIAEQTIAIAQPWQNGRIERFFGTLKQSLDQWIVNGQKSLQASLASFREWYGEVRPHIVVILVFHRRVECTRIELEGNAGSGERRASIYTRVSSYTGLA